MISKENYYIATMKGAALDSPRLFFSEQELIDMQNDSATLGTFDIPEKAKRIAKHFDNLNAIDWDKGCYVGQEITARMKYRGLLKKKLYALKIKNGDVLEGDELIVDNKKIGTIVSKANSNIFAALNINFVNEIKNKNQNLVINDSLSFDFLN